MGDEYILLCVFVAEIADYCTPVMRVLWYNNMVGQNTNDNIYIVCVEDSRCPLSLLVCQQ